MTMDDAQMSRLRDSLPGAELLETHISWILLHGGMAYKIKKPVKFSFLDFSTVEKRKFFCEEEVRLNRRLSPDVYLGVVPVNESGGDFSFGGPGRPVDYAVKMERLKQDGRMDILLSKGKIGRGHVRQIAGIIAGFHGRVETISDRNFGSAALAKGQIDDLGSFRGVIEKACGMGGKANYVIAKCDSFITKNEALFERRQAEGRIKECHGDLHSANIFIGASGKITIFDCIEFSRDFRCIDVASEVAFMAMDLDAFGEEEYSKLFVGRYVEETGDKELMGLLQLYKCYRANVRAKVAAIDYSQHPGGEAKERIMKYMLLAEKYADGL